MRAETPAQRRSASLSPRTASPSKLMLRRSPFALRRLSDLVSFLSLASMMRWPMRVLSAQRAMGTTRVGKIGAKKPPTWISVRKTPGKNAGISRESARKFRPATKSSSGRATPSTKPSAKAGPLGSLRTPASRSEEASGFRCNTAARSNHERTSTTASSAKDWAPRTPVGGVVFTTGFNGDAMLLSVGGAYLGMHILLIWLRQSSSQAWPAGAKYSDNASSTSDRDPSCPKRQKLQTLQSHPLPQRRR